MISVMPAIAAAPYIPSSRQKNSSAQSETFGAFGAPASAGTPAYSGTLELSENYDEAYAAAAKRLKKAIAGTALVFFGICSIHFMLKKRAMHKSKLEKEMVRQLRVKSGAAARMVI